MNDIYQYFGNDIVASATGSLQAVTGMEMGQQRILRRLLTNPGDYIFHPDYGAGLPKHVGDVVAGTFSVPAIQALIQGQMLLEQAVMQDPPPVVNVTQILDGVSVQILYADATTGSMQALAFDVTK